MCTFNGITTIKKLWGGFYESTGMIVTGNATNFLGKVLYDTTKYGPIGSTEVDNKCLINCTVSEFSLKAKNTGVYNFYTITQIYLNKVKDLDENITKKLKTPT